MWTWEAANPLEPFTPQGITSFVDEKAAQKLVVVSWHSDNGGDARISYLLKDDKGDQRYGHARLGDPGETSSLHAGGIACFANRLLVADTKIGIVAFDVANPRKGSDGIWQIDRCETYCLAREISDASLRLFSFADVDWTDHDHPMLLTGAYVDKSLAAKLHPSVLGWALEGSGPVKTAPDILLDSTDESFRYLQGIAHYGKTWYLSQSGSVHQIRSVDGELSASSPTFNQIANTTLGLEDLHIPSSGKSLWGLTENVAPDVRQYPRLIFRIPLPIKKA